MSDLARRLLDAHVAHELRHLEPERFAALVREEVEHALAAAETLTLEQAVRRELVKDVAHKYVGTFRLPAAIPELTAVIGARVRSHPANEVALGELISRQRVLELATALTEMRGLRSKVLRSLADSTALQAGVGEVVHGIATGALGTGRRLMKKVPLLSQGVGLAEAVTAPVLNPMTGALDQRSRELAERGAKVLLGYLGDSAAESVSDEELIAAVLEVWDAGSTRPVGSLLGVVSDEEVTDLFVAAYGVWQELRSSDYLRSLVEAGIDTVFDTYGGTSLAELIEEFGLGADDLVEEGLRFAPGAIDALREAGLLEAGIRRHLARFYLSTEAAELLGEQ